MSERRLVRMADVVGVLSLAADLGSGARLEHGLRTCLLATALVERAGAGADALRSAYWLSLLRLIGCNSTAHSLAALLGDELAPADWFGAADLGNPAELLPKLLAGATGGLPLPARAARLLRLLSALPGMRADSLAHCEVAMGLARRLPLAEEDRRLLAFAFERWNGAGPQRLRRSAIPFVAASVVFAHDAATLAEYLGTDAVLDTLRRRAGRTTDPELVHLLEAHASELLPLLSTPDAWTAVLDFEPRPVSLLDEAQLEDALVAVAEFADMKNLRAPLHSQRVARYAASAAQMCALPGEEQRRLRRAALIHDLGRTAISAAIWDRPGPLDADDWTQVRLYPFHAERMVGKSAALRAVGAVATMVAERLDGSGYHRGIAADAIPPPARILAAADVFAALTEPRPHRPAFDPHQAAELVLAEARSGRLDAEAAAAVIRAGGERAAAPRRVLPAGLTEREAEVLGLIAQGLSNREVADRFHISPKTVGNHVEHIYDKIGVSTRAAAALFAVQHGLVAANEVNTP